MNDIGERILWIRGHRVMLDVDLAVVYGVPTKRLNEQVRRNRKRFPPDFMFRLTLKEVQILRSQFATSSWGGRRYRPFVFTEHGAVMLSAVLQSRVAIQASLRVARAFIQLRKVVSLHAELTRQLAALERKVEGHDEDIKRIMDTFRLLEQAEPPAPPSRPIGFRERRAAYVV